MTTMPTHLRFQDLTGRTFGKLTVTNYAGKRGRVHCWVCSCSCGKTAPSVSGNAMRSGHTKSCGCINYGATSTPEYWIWHAMIERCTNPNNKKYRIYGERGISVCERWMTFAGFIADMGSRPTNKHSIDRYPNRDGDYEPSNCRWATIKEQNRNTGRNSFLTVRGETKTIAEWCEVANINRGTFSNRIKKGMDAESALFTPVDKFFARRTSRKP